MIDLKDLMDERSLGTPGFDHLRLASVQHRVTVRRRRRIIATALTAVVILLFAGYALSPAIKADSPLPPATGSPSPSLPPYLEYDFGRQLLASNRVPLTAGSLSLTWTPHVWENLIEVTCEGTELDLRTEMRINDYVMHTSEPCNLGLYAGRATLERAGVQLGLPSTLKITIVGAATGAGTLRVGVKVDVPFDAYPFPQRPAQLKPLMPLKSCEISSGKSSDVAIQLHSDPADPSKPVTVTLTWTGFLHMTNQMLTPGMLDFSFDGVYARTDTAWDYEGRSMTGSFDTSAIGDHWGPRPVPGSQTTLTVTPRKVSGPWQVGVVASLEASVCFMDSYGHLNLHTG